MYPIRRRKARLGHYRDVSQTPRQRELTTKRRGELAELAFVLKAANLGFGVAHPYGESERYDVTLDARPLHVGRTLPSAGLGQALSGAFDLQAAPGHEDVKRKKNGKKRKKDAKRKKKSLRPTQAVLTTLPPDPSPPLWRVQVKCSTQISTGLYRVNAHREAWHLLRP